MVENIRLEYLLIAFAVLAVILVIVIVLLILQAKKIKKLQERLDKFVLGKDAESLEQEITALIEDNKYLRENSDENKKNIEIIFQKMQSVYQKMGLVKYDAFEQMGGQLSFCLALLDENNNGFVMNSVHSTEGCYSYTKEIKAGESSVLLGKEEQEAVAAAMRGV